MQNGTDTPQPASAEVLDDEAADPAPSSSCIAWCLFLDVDGTLLDIAPAPDAVQVGTALKEVLHAASVALGGALALVSGRPIAALDQLFAPRHWPAAGLHGLERRDALGRLHRPVTDSRALDGARRALGILAAHTPGILVEDKSQSLALHYRTAPEQESLLRRTVHAVASELGADYHVLEGQCVFEIKPALATKADAVRAFLRESPFAGRRPIYVGDDVTDLDGFAAVERAGGLSVAVGDRVSARMHLASPAQVRQLLAGLAAGRGPEP